MGSSPSLSHSAGPRTSSQRDVRGWAWVRGPGPAPALHCSHGFWVLSPQVMVSYYQPDEEVPMATAELYLTGIGECCSHPWRGRVGWQRPGEGALPIMRCLPWVLRDSLDTPRTLLKARPPLLPPTSLSENRGHRTSVRSGHLPTHPSPVPMDEESGSNFITESFFLIHISEHPFSNSY